MKPEITPRDRLRQAALVFGLAALLTWLVDTMAAVPAWPARLVALAALITLVALALRWAGRQWRSGPEGKILLGLLGLSIAAHFVGLAHEVTTRYFGDEGIYLAQAQRINAGEPLRRWFIYPHLLFYLDAIALWLAGLFEAVVRPAADLLWGPLQDRDFQPLVSRWVTAAAGALTVIPVYSLGRRLGGRSGAWLAGLFGVLSALYIQVCHLNISDVLSAFFATWTLAACAKLLDEPTPRGYLAAGVLSGLAAGSKYPAGVVAVAIIGVFGHQLWRERRWSWGLVGAGLASIGAFVATTPSFLAYPDGLLAGGPDLFFGVRQYAEGGWAGVVRGSNMLFYLEQLAWSFGRAALLAGAVGLALLRGDHLRRVVWMLPFPLVYLALMNSMRIAVPRNILPTLPMLAVLVGVGVAALLGRFFRPGTPLGKVAPALVVLLLAIPTYRTVHQAVQFSRPNVRDVARTWMEENLPDGSYLVQEDYTPRFEPRAYLPSAKPRFITYFTEEQLRDPNHDFVLFSSEAYGRYLDPDNLVDPRIEANAAIYRELFETSEEVATFEPDFWQAGPTVRLFKIDPDPIEYPAFQTLPAADAFPAEQRMWREEGRLFYDDRAEWVLFKAFLKPGPHRLTVDAELAEPWGGLRVMNRDNQVVDFNEVKEGRSAVIDLPVADKYFFYLQLSEGSLLSGLSIERINPQAGGSPDEGASDEG